MRGTSPMDRANVKTTWIGGSCPLASQGGHERYLRSVARDTGARRVAAQSGNLESRIIAHFSANPTSEFNAKAISEAVNCHVKYASPILARLERQGVLSKRTVARDMARLRIYKVAA